jgi:hypothetical protein
MLFIYEVIPSTYISMIVRDEAMNWIQMSRNKKLEDLWTLWRIFELRKGIS